MTIRGLNSARTSTFGAVALLPCKSFSEPRAGAAFRGQFRAITHDRIRIAPAIGLHDRRQTLSGREVVLRDANTDRVARDGGDPAFQFALTDCAQQLHLE